MPVKDVSTKWIDRIVVVLVLAAVVSFVALLLIKQSPSCVRSSGQLPSEIRTASSNPVRLGGDAS